MLIHNVYADLLTSISYFLNDSILLDSHIKIKSYQFNIGNASFQLDDKKTQVELPAAIITLQAITPSIPHLFVFHRNLAIGNKFRTPVLYNRTKNIELEIQEEMYIVAVNININCDSQLQALEIQHRLLNYLPLNKYLQAYKYVSYLEIDLNFLNNYLFDVERDRIENLFLKHDKYTNTFSHCFSIEYEPLIRQNSCDLTIDVSTSSSFLVASTFEFFQHVGVYLVGPKIDYDNLVSKNELQYTNIPVPVLDNGENILIDLINIDTKLMVSEISNGFNSSPNCMITGTFTNIKLDYDAITIFNEVKYDGVIHIVKDLLTDSYINTRCFIEGDRINGTLREIQDVSPTIIRAYFNGLIGKNNESQYLDFEIHLYDSIYEIDSSISTIVNPPLSLIKYKTLPKLNNILNSIPNINKSAVSINLKNTYITQIVLLDNTIISLDEVVFINEATYEFVLNFNNITATGRIDPFNGEIFLDSDIIKYLYINVNLNLVRGLPTSIERINTNFNLTNEIVSKNSPYDVLKEYSSDYDIVLVNELNYDTEKNQFFIRVQDISLIGLTYKFIFDKIMIESNQVILNTNLSTSSLFVFDLQNRFIYNRLLENVSRTNPLYFCYNNR